MVARYNAWRSELACEPLVAFHVAHLFLAKFLLLGFHLTEVSLSQRRFARRLAGGACRLASGSASGACHFPSGPTSGAFRLARSPLCRRHSCSPLLSDAKMNALIFADFAVARGKSIVFANLCTPEEPTPPA